MFFSKGKASKGLRSAWPPSNSIHPDEARQLPVLAQALRQKVMTHSSNLVRDTVRFYENVPKLDIHEALQGEADVRDDKIQFPRAHPGAKHRVDDTKTVPLDLKPLKNQHANYRQSRSKCHSFRH